MMDERDAEPTKRTSITRGHGDRGDCRALADELAQLRTDIESDRAVRSSQRRESERRTASWRWAGGIAATVALSIAAAALQLGVTASTDHELVQRHEVALRERREEDAQSVERRHELDRRLLEQSARTATLIEEMRTAITDLRTDVREIRAEMREEGRHR